MYGNHHCKENQENGGCRPAGDIRVLQVASGSWSDASLQWSPWQATLAWQSSLEQRWGEELRNEQRGAGRAGTWVSN